MLPQSDAQLLRAYAMQGSEAAFAELVARHTDLVYSAALRQVGSADLARDVAQSVFTDLARKGASLSRGQQEHASLAGWLYRSSRYAANTLLRNDRRRQQRERQSMQEFDAVCHSVADWENVGPVLDEAMAELGDEDRDALVLRFFKNQDFRTVGEALGISDDTAQKRVSRALEKLRSLLSQRGVTTTATGLSSIIAVNAIQAAPAGLAAVLTHSSLAGVAAGTGSALTTLEVMSMTKLKAGIVGAILATAIATTVVLRSQAKLNAENEALRQQLARLRTPTESIAGRTAPGGAPLAMSRPAPPLPAATTPAESAKDASVNLIARILQGEKAPLLTREQAEAYLQENHRSAASLLAAFRVTGNDELLAEAMEKYPNDPQVAFTAIYKKDSPPEERRRWLETFKRTNSQNPLANYLSALDYLKGGQSDQAVEELMAASARKRFDDFSWDFIQNSEEAYRSAGYAVSEAKTISAASLLLPHLMDMRDLSFDMEKLANAYRDMGDMASAEAALQMSITIGQQLSDKSGNPLITQLVGLAIEENAIRKMQEAASATHPDERLKARLSDVAQKRADIKEYAKQFEELQSSLSGQDWISYFDRWRYFGEEAASRWLLEKYGHAKTQ